MPLTKKLVLFLLLFVVVSVSVVADTASLLLLYTNDIHDYVRPGANNTGGMPYLAGYVAEMRGQRGDVLLLDGGDVMEKGDMVAFKTKSRITYEAMAKMGYDAGAVGNHDLAYGIEHLRECAALADMALVCLNHFDDEGNLAFPGSTVIEINGITIGIIGMTNIRGSIEEDGARLAKEAKRLHEQAHLLIVVAHIGSRECAQLSVMAPEVDLFVTGHTHEALSEPVVVPETDALLVGAGQYAEYIGHLELAVDRSQKKIVYAENKLVAMCHDAIEPDREMVAWIQEQEQQHCPEAPEVIGHASRFINSTEMGRLAAGALREKAEVDVGFCHAGHVMRSGVFAGDVDVNMLFRTGGSRGRDLVLFHMSGAQIEAYMAGLIAERRGRTEWAGFRAKLTFDAEVGDWSVATDLEPDRTYRVIMANRERENRFQRIIRDHPLFKDFHEQTIADAPYTFIQAITAYVKQAIPNNEPIDKHIEALVEIRSL